MERVFTQNPTQQQVSDSTGHEYSTVFAETCDKEIRDTFRNG